MSKPKRPDPNLIRPIRYPKLSGDTRSGAAARTQAEIAAMNDPFNPASGQRAALERDGRVLPERACVHCRQLSGHSPLCPTRFQDVYPS